MRENCTSGSVRGEGGNILTYSAGHFVDAACPIKMVEAIEYVFQGQGQSARSGSTMYRAAPAPNFPLPS